MRDPISRLLSATNAEIAGGAKSFRSLWSGLDIIRKALGSSRLQSVQTTAIDAASGDHQPDRPPGPRIRRMDRFGLASLSFGTHGEPASNWCHAHLCAAGGTPCSRWSGSWAKMTSMRRIRMVLGPEPFPEGMAKVFQSRPGPIREIAESCAPHSRALVVRDAVITIYMTSRISRSTAPEFHFPFHYQDSSGKCLFGKSNARQPNHEFSELWIG
jgi:hypothetical protein